MNTVYLSWCNIICSLPSETVVFSLDFISRNIGTLGKTKLPPSGANIKCPIFLVWQALTYMYVCFLQSLPRPSSFNHFINNALWVGFYKTNNISEDIKVTDMFTVWRLSWRAHEIPPSPIPTKKFQIRIHPDDLALHVHLVFVTGSYLGAKIDNQTNKLMTFSDLRFYGIASQTPISVWFIIKRDQT